MKIHFQILDVKLKLPLQSIYIASICCFDYINAEIEQDITIFKNQHLDFFSIDVTKKLCTELFRPYYHTCTHNQCTYNHTRAYTKYRGIASIYFNIFRNIFFTKMFI